MHAAASDDLILVRTLLELGLPSSTIAFRCRKVGGSWWRPLQGLLALARGTLTVRQRLVAALLAAGDDAVVTGLAACRLYGLERAPAHDQVHVLVRHEHRRRSEGFLLVERTGRMLPARSRDGIRSAAEAWLREQVATMDGFPEVQWNADVHFETGTFLACPDGFVDDCALALDLHSFAHHADLEKFDATMRRQAEMIAAGLVVVPITPKELRQDPEGVKRKLWAALEQARLRPRPPVVMKPRG